MRVERKNYIVDYNHTRLRGSVQVLVRRFKGTSFESARRRAFAALRKEDVPFTRKGSIMMGLDPSVPFGYFHYIEPWSAFRIEL